MDQVHSTTEQHVKGKHLTYDERMIIQIRHKEGCSPNHTAAEIGCASNTVRNELRRRHPNLFGLPYGYSVINVQLVIAIKYDFSEKARLSCPHISETGRKNATYLKEVMEQVGFQGYDREWWHFYDVSAEPVPFSDYPI